MLTAEPIGKRKSQWGEGPVWHDSKLTYVDIAGKAIVTLDPESKQETVIELDQNVGFTVPCQSGKWIYGGNDGLFFLNPSSQESTPITNPEADIPENRFNDGKVSPDGRLFAGSIAQTKKEGTARLYRMDSDLVCHLAYQPVTNSNGLAWSGDLKTFYYIDTPSKEIKAFDYDAETGAITNARPCIDTSAIQASPDGMCIDRDDNLWVAFCHGGCVIQFDPSTGRQIQKIVVPALETTSCVFGGPEGDQLFITSGIKKDEPEELGGSLFVVSDTGTSAPPATPFPDI